MLKQDKPTKEIAEYLTKIACDRMGFKKSIESERKDLEIANLLQSHKRFLAAKFRGAEQ